MCRGLRTNSHEQRDKTCGKCFSHFYIILPCFFLLLISLKSSYELFQISYQAEISLIFEQVFSMFITLDLLNVVFFADLSFLPFTSSSLILIFFLPQLIIHLDRSGITPYGTFTPCLDDTEKLPFQFLLSLAI